ncbi:hypothetical protein ACE6H2_000718 [Prunus campanulata]
MGILPKRKANTSPDSITRGDVWIRGHTRKSGGFLNEEVANAVKKIEEENKNAALAEKYSIKNDALVKALGPERRGRVRGLGFGAKPSNVGTQTYTRDRVIKLEKEVEELKNIVNSLLAGSKRKHANSFPCVNANAQGFGSLEANSTNQASSPNIQANSANCKAKSVNLQSKSKSINHKAIKNDAFEASSANHKAIKNDALEASSANHKAKSANLLSKSVNLEAFSTHHHSNSANLQGKKCKLLQWAGSGEVVALAEISSTNPQDNVHFVPLRPDCWKVWVLEVLVGSQPLFRPTREFFLIEDVVLSTTAWPIKFISFD